MIYLLALLSISGHTAASIVVINRLHSTSMPHWCLKLVDFLWMGCIFAAPAIWGVRFLAPAWFEIYHQVINLLFWMHFSLSMTMLIGIVPDWISRQFFRKPTLKLLKCQRQRINVLEKLDQRPVNHPRTHWMSRLPGNEVFQLEVNQKDLSLPRLHPQIDGLTITHLSDLHFTGKVTPEYYEFVVDKANQLGSDLIAVTGDLIDKPHCMPWLGDILGRLRAPLGVYFVLGNHDLRVKDEAGVRRRLTERGLIDLGKRWIEINVNGQPIILAGNELPWFLPAADLSNAPDSPLRILLSHAPDQFAWAQSFHVDLMLAGHTHGGQIQIPFLGPIFSPSRHGVRYASGTFYQSPTLMHVSRGISGTRYLRYGAPPELSRLVLKAERLTNRNEAARDNKHSRATDETTSEGAPLELISSS